MAFLSGLAANIAKWLIEKVGLWLINFFKDFFRKKEEKQVEKENLEEYKEAVKDGDHERRKRATRDIINGTNDKHR